MSIGLELLPIVYATDESILIRAGGDYGVICPKWQKSAYGTDGVLSGWGLTSASVNFLANGVAPNQVVKLDRPSTAFAGSGEYFAVDTVAMNAVTLRRPGQLAGVGQSPPAVPAVQFTITTLGPQIEEASFDLNVRFNLGGPDPCRSPTGITDLRVLRKACVLMVLKARYLEEARDKAGDFWGKFNAIDKELADVMETIRVRWGTSTVETQPADSLFDMRMTR